MAGITFDHDKATQTYFKSKFRLRLEVIIIKSIINPNSEIIENVLKVLFSFTRHWPSSGIVTHCDYVFSSCYVYYKKVKMKKPSAQELTIILTKNSHFFVPLKLAFIIN